ncbi:uncharacterized protein LOC131078793 [Cryptomeria japonica]|uniref:uncharacterized protein LOC131078793 n=1 Tax=Cryptomeria japonica TaxID=3369 RepID=UPI0025AD3A7F|nr:uncharacterized protein LOC131078793 [Cryptomeria japonica]
MAEAGAAGGDKDKPPDTPEAVVDLQSNGTLPEETAGSSGLLGEGSNGGPIPRDDSVDNGREKKKWSSLFGTRPTGKSSLPPVKNISDPSDDMSDSAFFEEESDSDSSSDTEDSFEDSEYESGKKRRYKKTRPSSSKGKKPQSKPLISISLEGEDSDDSEKENPKGLLKKKTKIHTRTRKKHKKKEETGKEPEVDKQARTLEA